MTKQEQINELRDLIMIGSRLDVDSATAFAETLYRRGYRKQSEWISVDERLPESDARVLVYMNENRMSYARIDTDRIVKRGWVRWGDCVTHWMPIPEAPKGDRHADA